MNEQVKRWTSKLNGDPNHKGQHAEALGIEFFRFPYQPYLSPQIAGKYTAHVTTAYYSKDHGSVYYANIYQNRLDGSGHADRIDHKECTDQDDAILWAAQALRKLEKES